MSKGPHSKLRRAARLAAVQALYQMDVGGTLSTSVVKEFIEHRFGHAMNSKYPIGVAPLDMKYSADQMCLRS